jgi:hypothetical protein
LAFKSIVFVAEIEIKLGILDGRTAVWSSQSSISVELVKLGGEFFCSTKAAEIVFKLRLKPLQLIFFKLSFGQKYITLLKQFSYRGDTLVEVEVAIKVNRLLEKSWNLLQPFFFIVLLFYFSTRKGEAVSSISSSCSL